MDVGLQKAWRLTSPFLSWSVSYGTATGLLLTTNDRVMLKAKSRFADSNKGQLTHLYSLWTTLYRVEARRHMCSTRRTRRLRIRRLRRRD